jgi:hypothetical protein
MLIATDNDMVGAVRVFRRILASPEWVELTATLEIEFIELKDVALPADASDIAVWQSSQEVGALLITGNRSSGEGSSDQTIAEQGSPESLPVLTIGDPRRVIRDPVYARECALACWTSLIGLRRCVVLVVFLSLKPDRRDHASTYMERPYRFQSIRVG